MKKRKSPKVDKYCREKGTEERRGRGGVQSKVIYVSCERKSKTKRKIMDNGEGEG